MTLLRDFRGHMSWGRVCAMAALVVAVWGEFRGIDLEHLKLWLGVAVGNYGASKLTEMVSVLKVGVSAPSAPGVGPASGGSVGSSKPGCSSDSDGALQRRTHEENR